MVLVMAGIYTAREFNFTSYVAADNMESNKWKIEGYPTVLIFDRAGRLRYSGQLNIEPTVPVNNTYRIINSLKQEVTGT